MEREKMSKESRDELLERILEETARNPYKRTNTTGSRPATARKPVKPASVQPQNMAVSKEAAPVKKQPVKNDTERTQVFSSDELHQMTAQQSASVPQTKQAQNELTQVLPAQYDFKQETNLQPTVSEQEMQSAAEKIQKIKQEKAAAAKAAIMRKAEIDNSRMMLNAESGSVQQQAPSFSGGNNDEKVNIVMPEDEYAQEEYFDDGYTAERKPVAARILAVSNYVLYAVFVILVVFNFILSFVGMSGSSMLPTINDGDMLLVMNVGYTPQRGDVVIIDNKTAALIDENGNVTEKKGLDCIISKRVIAVGGDTVNFDFEKGTVSVNNEILDESYISEPTVRNEGAFEYPLTVPEGYVFVLSDNRNESKDSRHSDIGLVPADEVTGKVIMKALPFGMLD